MMPGRLSGFHRPRRPTTSPAAADAVCRPRGGQSPLTLGWRDRAAVAAGRRRMDDLTDRAGLRLVPGLDSWVRPRQGDAAPPDPPPPSRARQTVAVWLALVPLVTGFSTVAGAVLPTVPPIARTLVTLSIVVPTMSYAAMPAITWLLGDWLNPPPGPCPAAAS